MILLKVSDCFERTEKLTELIYAGIPHSMRVHVSLFWMFLFKKKYNIKYTLVIIIIFIQIFYL